MDRKLLERKYANRHRLLGSVCLLVLLTLMPGCGSLFGKRKIEQLQSESERLLTEYRLERDRAKRLDIQNRALTDRIAQLETQLAARIDGYGASRIAGRARPSDGPSRQHRDQWQPAARR